MNALMQRNFKINMLLREVREEIIKLLYLLHSKCLIFQVTILMKCDVFARDTVFL